MFRSKSRFLGIAGAIAAVALALTAFPLAASAAPADGTGFTAAIVATSGQTITGTVDATGYDVGIYIGPGVRNVMVSSANVSGANDQGILVQDAANIIIENSTVSGNALDAAAGLSEVKGIVLAGTRNSVVRNNTVEDNNRGGIALLDDGPDHPFAPDTVAAAPIASTGNLITGNTIKDNEGDCGLVVSAKNPGGGVSHNVVSKNSVLGFDPAGGDLVPGVGGIVVAGGASGPVNMVGNVILGNTVTGGFIPGISLHAFGPGVLTGTNLIGNVLKNNGAGELSGNTTGIEIFAVPDVGVITGTQVLNDTVSNDYYGVWVGFSPGTHIANLNTSAVNVKIVTVP